ncbi:riboflavin-binding protein-like [Pantherophis guttatus]|uniref:Riboflavin-binding protein-like n=1 Tax=Pantherophis guttatus TaxID=94885 RepID=A0A6P9BJ68_PANGU|nr:riboflavin-binding protein-like [Pantherophis guttatus]
MLRFSVLLFLAVLMSSTGQRQRCLRGAGHKPRPTQEKYLQECTLYAKSACCYPNITEQLADSPVVKINTTFWNRCGNLSPECEAYMKKIECFYRCSPYIAYWARPRQPAAISSVPICKRFCDNWYEACKSDHTCVSNSLTDWKIDEKGENHCKNDCIPISEMYASGTHMCEKMWGASLKVAYRSPCLCLEMDEMDPEVIKFIQYRSSSSSSSSSSSDNNDEERFCRLRMQMRRELEDKYKSLENNELPIDDI